MVSMATSVSMAVDATSGIVSVATADSTDSDQLISSTDVVETIEENQDGKFLKLSFSQIIKSFIR